MLPTEVAVASPEAACGHLCRHRASCPAVGQRQCRCSRSGVGMLACWRRQCVVPPACLRMSFYGRGMAGTCSTVRCSVGVFAPLRTRSQRRPPAKPRGGLSWCPGVLTSGGALVAAERLRSAAQTTLLVAAQWTRGAAQMTLLVAAQRLRGAARMILLVAAQRLRHRWRCSLQLSG